MGRSKKDVQPYWRPNFVNTSNLPDIKVVRTDFIVNVVSVVLMLFVGVFVLQREYRAYSLAQTVEGMEQEISAADAADASFLKQSQEFRDLAVNVAELEKFFTTPFSAQDFLVEITEMRPEELIFKQLSLVESAQKEGTTSVVTYQMAISGEVRSLTILDKFKGELIDWELLNVDGYVLEVDEAVRGRDPKTGIFPYTLGISLKPEKKAAAPKGADA